MTKQDGWRIVYDQPMQLGECPLWDPDEQRLYWVDIEGKAVHEHDPETGAHRAWQMDTEVGCIAFHRDGGLVVALRTHVAHLDTSSGFLTTIAAAPYDPSHTRFNDGRCDAQGRFWVGTIYEPRDQPRGSLYCLDGGKWFDTGKPLTVSNGLAFDARAARVYHADTRAHRIDWHPLESGTDTFGPANLFVQFSDVKDGNYGGRPDGAALDADGNYWCAMFEGGRILKISPQGAILAVLQVPARCPTMVAFGGPNLSTLFVTTARHNRSPDELAAYPLSGCVLAYDVGSTGVAEYDYAPR